MNSKQIGVQLLGRSQAATLRGQNSTPTPYSWGRVWIYRGIGEYIGEYRNIYKSIGLYKYTRVGIYGVGVEFYPPPIR